jgi:translation initiation factor IF-1
MIRTRVHEVILFLGAFVAAMALAGCVPLESAPTLNEVRLGHGKGRLASDTTLESGEIRGEVTQIDPGRREVLVQTDDGRRQVLPYDINGTRVFYHGREYNVESLESGDIVAFRFPYRSSYVERIRVQEPVQARAGTTLAGRAPLAPNSTVVEGTVERLHPNLGAFDVRSRSGRMVTVSVPYNARTADVDNFRRLRTGDYVRIEGEFVNSDNLQLLAFLSPR